MLHALVLVVPRHLTEAHSFPITVLVNHTYFILERKKKANKKQKTKKKLKQQQALLSDLCPDTACLASFIASQHIKSNMK